jgi:hypothetical protein
MRHGGRIGALRCVILGSMIAICTLTLSLSSHQLTHPGILRPSVDCR